MPTRSLPELISFDLDGTLIDSVPDLAWATDQSLLAMGYPARGEDKIRSWIGNGAAMLLRRALGDGDEHAITEQAVLDQARTHFNHFYGEHFAVDTVVYPGVFEALDWIAAKGIPMALITNKPIAFAEPILAELKLAQYFKWTLGGDSLEKAKPDPMPLLHIAQKAERAPSKSLHIGDSRTDVEAAKNAGFASLAVTFGYNHGEPIQDAKPDMLMDDWAEFVGLFD